MLDAAQLHSIHVADQNAAAAKEWAAAARGKGMLCLLARGLKDGQIGDQQALDIIHAYRADPRGFDLKVTFAQLAAEQEGPPQ